MDINCPRCAEPVEIDYLHEVAEVEGQYGDGGTFADVLRAFQRDGCSALGARCNPRVTDRDRARAAGAALLYDLLGDDIDGAAAMLEDFGAMGVWS